MLTMIVHATQSSRPSGSGHGELSRNGRVLPVRPSWLSLPFHPQHMGTSDVGEFNYLRTLKKSNRTWYLG